MRNRELHDALREFALETAAMLSTELDAGEELPYDVVEEPGTGSVLYRYLPLTAEFIAARWDAIGAMPSAGRAATALGDGAEAYLRLRGLPAADDAEPALRAMLERLYEDATDFQFPEERFERVYSEVERTLYEGTMRTAVVATLTGLVLESDRVDLGGGLMLARGNRIDAPPEAVWPLAPGERERATGPNSVCALERDIEADSPLPASEARIRFRRLLTAMRLFKPGRLALLGLGWGRADGGVWQPVSLALAGAGRGDPWVLTAAEEAELRELTELVARTRQPGRVAWALARFEMGCERSTDVEALSDNLLALQALLETDGDAGEASLTQRLAALCAEPADRPVTRRRLDEAFALERRAMAGGVIDPDLEEGEEGETPHALCAEIEQHVRALLRDVICGYLDADLRALADDILIAGDEPIEIRARDTREEPEPEPEPEDAWHAAPAELGEQGELAVEQGEPAVEPARRRRARGLFARTEPEPEPEPEWETEPEPSHPAVNAQTRLPDGPGTAADPRSAAWAVASLPGPRTIREAPPPRLEDRVDVEVEVEAYADEPTIADEPLPAEDVEAGVIHSSDWDLDEDPASYSAPI
jgi:hypothetical protein